MVLSGFVVVGVSVVAADQNGNGSEDKSYGTVAMIRLFLVCWSVGCSLANSWS